MLKQFPFEHENGAINQKEEKFLVELANILDSSQWHCMVLQPEGAVVTLVEDEKGKVEEIAPDILRRCLMAFDRFLKNEDE